MSCALWNDCIARLDLARSLIDGDYICDGESVVQTRWDGVVVLDASPTYRVLAHHRMESDSSDSMPRRHFRIIKFFCGPIPVFTVLVRKWIESLQQGRKPMRRLFACFGITMTLAAAVIAQPPDDRPGRRGGEPGGPGGGPPQVCVRLS